MADPVDAPEAWEARARAGDRAALGALFDAHRDRLRRWIDLRLDPRLRGRVDASDVLQDAYLAAERRLDHFRALGDLPFPVWARLVAGQRLVEAHRRHLGAGARAAAREVALDAPVLDPESGAGRLADRLAADLTSPSQAAARHEARDLLARAIAALEPLDREVLALRHFDELANDDVARLLGIPRGTASKRYVRALARLRAALEAIPDLLDPQP